jgi:intracellular septation protein A
MSNLQTAQSEQGGGPGLRQKFGSLLPSMVISAALPLIIYLMASPHMPSISALALTAVPPLLFSAYGWARTRRIDPISLMTLFTVVVSVLIALLIHDPHLILVRDSFLTATFGVLCLISLMTSRPMGYYVYRWVFVHTPEQLASLEAGWKVPYSRFARRLVTVVWGLAFLGEALVEIFLAYHISTAQFVGIHPFLFWGTIAATMGWATVFSRHGQQKLKAGPSPSAPG